MDEQLSKRLDEQDKLLVEIYKSVEKTRKYFQWTLIVTIIVLALPLIGLMFIIPQFLSVYSSGMGL